MSHDHRPPHGHDHGHHGHGHHDHPPHGGPKPFRVVPRWFFAVGAVLLLLVILTWVLI
jgi:hypothetical protein